MNAIVVCSSLLLVRRFFASGNKLDDFLAGVMLYFAQITLTEIFLGTLNQLYLANLIFLNLMLLVLVLMLSWHKNVGIKANFDLSWIFKSKLILCCIAVAAAFILVKSVLNLMNPPFGWDSLIDHFAFPAGWIKSHSLYRPITVFGEPAPSYYPINGELFYLWLMFPFKSTFLADLGQLPFYIISVLSVYGICRKMDLKREISFYAAAIFALSPSFLSQISVAYTDIIIAG